MTGIHYIAPVDLSIMPQWHYPRLDDPKRRWKVSRWELYSAPGTVGPVDVVPHPGFRTPGFLQSEHTEQIHK
jgi:hypothetical protein